MSLFFTAMFDSLKLRFALMMERKARKIKLSYARKRLAVFLEKYSLHDGIQKPKIDIRFNPYEGTSLPLIDELIQSREITPEDTIIDIGCGAGIFILYISAKGFGNVRGVEFDDELYSLCRKNISSFSGHNRFIPEVIHVNALDYDMPDDVNIFYLFNTFYDKDTYAKWLQKVSQSLERRIRPVKIIILFPTVASMGAMRACSWLHEKGRVLCKSVNCYPCMNFIIYENSTCINNQQS